MLLLLVTQSIVGSLRWSVLCLVYPLLIKHYYMWFFKWWINITSCWGELCVWLMEIKRTDLFHFMIMSSNVSPQSNNMIYIQIQLIYMYKYYAPSVWFVTYAAGKKRNSTLTCKLKLLNHGPCIQHTMCTQHPVNIRCYVCIIYIEVNVHALFMSWLFIDYLFNNSPYLITRTMNSSVPANRHLSFMSYWLHLYGGIVCMNRVIKKMVEYKCTSCFPVTLTILFMTWTYGKLISRATNLCNVD